MNPLPPHEEQRLQSLLAGRAEQLRVEEPFPFVDHSESTDRSGLSRAALLAAVATFALVTFGLIGLFGTGNDRVGPAATDDGADGDLVAWVDPTADGIAVADSIDPLPGGWRYVWPRRGLTGEALATYWAENQDVVAQFEAGVVPTAIRVDADTANRAERRQQLLAIPGVIRVDDYPGCGAVDSPFPPDCPQPSGRATTALVAGASIAAILLLARLLPLPDGVVTSLVLLVLVFGVIHLVIGPVHREVERASPALAEIREQAGRNLSCDEWYTVEARTRFASDVRPPVELRDIDPALVGFVMDEGRDIYLWGIPGFVVIVLAIPVAGYAILLPQRRNWMLAMLALTVAGCVWTGAHYPAGADESAIQCMAE